MLTGGLALGSLVAMERFSGVDRALCVQEFYKNSDSATAEGRKFCNIQGFRYLNKAPSIQFIQKWVKKIEEIGTTLEKPKSGRPRSSLTPDNVESVNQSVRDDPNISVGKCVSAFNVPRSSLHRIMHKDLKLHPYKIQLVHELKSQDTSQRLNFVNQAIKRLAFQRPDLTPMDFFLWGYHKSKVYASRSTSLAHLNENIRHEMTIITESTYRAVIRNFSVRINECREHKGLHLGDIIFRK